jgi:site-specific DNA-cytosine methylase
MLEDSSQGLEDWNLDLNERDSQSNGSSRLNPMQSISSEKDFPELKFMEILQKSISEIYRESRYSSEAFPAKTSATQEKKQESQEQKAHSGNNISEPFARYDPDTQSLKTYQPSLIEESKQLSLTFPKSAMLANGLLYQLPNLAHPTEENEYLLLPTPTAQETHRRDYRGYLNQYVKLCPITDQINIKYGTAVETLKGGKLNPDWVEIIMGFPFGFTNINQSGVDKNWLGCWNKKDQPSVPRLTMTSLNREKRIRCLGNAVVPQCAQAIARTIKKIEENTQWDYKQE